MGRIIWPILKVNKGFALAYGSLFEQCRYFRIIVQKSDHSVNVVTRQDLTGPVDIFLEATVFECTNPGYESEWSLSWKSRPSFKLWNFARITV